MWCFSLPPALSALSLHELFEDILAKAKSAIPLRKHPFSSASLSLALLWFLLRAGSKLSILCKLQRQLYLFLFLLVGYFDISLHLLHFNLYLNKYLAFLLEEVQVPGMHLCSCLEFSSLAYWALATWGSFGLGFITFWCLCEILIIAHKIVGF